MPAADMTRFYLKNWDFTPDKQKAL